MRKKTLLSWSSGKDSAWALHVLRQQPEVEVVGLLTTVNQLYQRIAIHAVRLELLRLQAAAVGLPLHIIELPYPCTNAEYEAAMEKFIADAKQQGIQCMAFGDLFLEDIRRYRIEKLAGTGLTPIFPLFNADTPKLAREMVAGGLKARLTCVNPKVLDAKFAGRDFDTALLDELPASCDPCGERGEFHSFAYAGPMFSAPIPIASGEIVERDGFVFADVLPSAHAVPPANVQINAQITKCPNATIRSTRADPS